MDHFAHIASETYHKKKRHQKRKKTTTCFPMWCFREFCSLSSKARQSCDGRGDSGLDQRDAILPPKSGGLGTRWQCEIQGGSWNNDCSITLARVIFCNLMISCC